MGMVSLINPFSPTSIALGGYALSDAAANVASRNPDYFSSSVDPFGYGLAAQMEKQRGQAAPADKGGQAINDFLKKVGRGLPPFPGIGRLVDPPSLSSLRGQPFNLGQYTPQQGGAMPPVQNYGAPHLPLAVNQFAPRPPVADADLWVNSAGQPSGGPPSAQAASASPSPQPTPLPPATGPNPFAGGVGRGPMPGQPMPGQGVTLPQAPPVIPPWMKPSGVAALGDDHPTNPLGNPFAGFMQLFNSKNKNSSNYTLPDFQLMGR